jgi:hypothetical protein
MKKLFLAIRHGDLELVKKIIEAKPELVDCTAKQPPKKDDGQSPLQVALKTEQHEIANSVFCFRWNTYHANQELEVRSTKENADAAYDILERMLKNGADINADIEEIINEEDG